MTSMVTGRELRDRRVHVVGVARADHDARAFARRARCDRKADACAAPEHDDSLVFQVGHLPQNGHCAEMKQTHGCHRKDANLASMPSPGIRMPPLIDELDLLAAVVETGSFIRAGE